MTTVAPEEDISSIIEENKKFIEDNADKLDKSLTLVKIGMLRDANTTFMTGAIFVRDINFVPQPFGSFAATDGERIILDAKHWMNTTPKINTAKIIHEGTHELLLHLDRLPPATENEAKKINIAVDCVTEALRVVCLGGDVMEEALIKPTQDGTVALNINGKKLIISKCHEKSAEEVLEIIEKHIKENPGKEPGRKPGKDPAPGGDQYTDGDGNPGKIPDHKFKKLTPSERANLERKARETLTSGKLKGDMPGAFVSAIEKMLAGKVNWKAELREMITPEIKTAQSYKRPNRRRQGGQIIYPGWRKEGVSVVFAFDTSGSMGKKELEGGLGEVANLFKQFEPGAVNMHVLLHNTEVYREFDLKDVRDVKTFDVEDGGTSHAEVFEVAEKMKAQVLICFTDGYSDFPESTKIRKVLWVVTDEDGVSRIPKNLGKVIHVPMKDLIGDD